MPYRPLPLLAALALLTGCLDGSGSSSELSTPEATAAYVRAAQQAQHGGNAPVAVQRVGHWQGRLTVGTRAMPLVGVATAQGLVLLHRADTGGDAVVLRYLQAEGGRLTGLLRLTRADGVTTDYALEGPAAAGRLSGTVMPPGWTLAEYSAGTRQPLPSEQALFGQLELVRAEPPVPLARVEPGRAARPAGEEGGALTVAVSPSGALTAQADGCSFEGGVTPSSSVGGAMEVAGVASGSACQITGEVTGLLTDGGGGLLTLALTDGTRASAKTFSWPAR